MPMCYALFDQANDIALALNMSQFFCSHIRPIHHLNGNRSQVAKDFFARRAFKDVRYVLADL